MNLDDLAGLAETALESQHVIDHYISLDTDQEPDWPKHRQALDEFNCHFRPREALALLMVAKAAKRLVTATYTIADTGCFNAADDAVKQAENALTALESP